MSDIHIDHHFTFGQAHHARYFLHSGMRLADYWVTVRMEKDSGETHRDLFVRNFTKPYCPRPSQYALEYDDASLQPQYYPAGQLCVVTSKGIRPPDRPLARFRYAGPVEGDSPVWVEWATLGTPAIAAARPTDVDRPMPHNWRDMLTRPLKVGDSVPTLGGGTLSRIR